MKKRHSVIARVALLALLVSSCQKTDKKYTVTGGVFPANTFTASTAAPALTYANRSDTAIKFAWGAATFGNEVVVTYTIQFDVPSDTAGGNWTNASNVYVGNNTYNLTMLVQDLNSAVLAGGAAAGVSNTVLVRVKATLTNISSNTAAPDVVPGYSNLVVLTVDPYALGFYVPSSSYGWNFSYAPKLNLVPDSSGIYEGFVYLPGTGTQSVKLTSGLNFLGTDYGADSTALVQASGTTLPLTVSTGGYYEIRVDQSNANYWVLTPSTWSVIGDATPAGWSTDNEMIYDSTLQVWYIDSLSLATTGSFKFRQSNAWHVDFGYAGAGTTNGNSMTAPLLYVDNNLDNGNVFLAYNNQPNLTVAVTGIYKVTLDLHISGTYTYTLLKE